MWLAPRAIAALFALALVCALAAATRAFAVVALAAGALFLALVVADALLGPRRAALRAERLEPAPLALRRAGEFRYRLTNRSAGRVRFALLEAPLETLAGLEEPLQGVAEPFSATELSVEVRPRERGLVRFGSLYGWYQNDVGFLRRRFRADAPGTVRVFPDLRAVERYGFLARRSTLLDAGLRKLRLRGAGTEFESLRDYTAGDAFRAINWKATARRGRLTVEQYEVERSQQVLVALDAGRLMLPRIGMQRKFDYALTGALSVARVAERAGDNVGLLAFAVKPLLTIAPRRGAGHVNALAQAAYDLQPRLEEPDYETTFSTIKRRYSKRSLIVLFTDMFDPVTSAAVLGGLRTLVPRHLVMCVLMNDVAISSALETVPRTPREAYRSAVAMELSDERERSIASLRALGIVVVDVPAPQLSVALIDAYLDVKARGLI